jgi:hypothetical protein
MHFWLDGLLPSLGLFLVVFFVVDQGAVERLIEDHFLSYLTHFRLCY